MRWSAYIWHTWHHSYFVLIENLRCEFSSVKQSGTKLNLIFSISKWTLSLWLCYRAEFLFEWLTFETIFIIFSLGAKQLELFQLEESNKVHGGTVRKLDLKGKTNKSTKEVLDDPIDIQRREKVKDAMLHAWSSYEKYAWGQDELQVWLISIANTQPFNFLFYCIMI